jgi:hypothetical protein
MRYWSTTLIVGTFAACLVVAACNSSTSTLPIVHHHRPSGQVIYWDTFSGTPAPQIDEVNLPLTTGSTPTTVSYSAGNNLDFSNGMAFDSSGRLWVLSFPPGGGSETAEVFTPPVGASSTAALTFTLSGVGDVSTIVFDASGNLWGADFADSKVYEYTGPFTTSGTLTPALTLTSGIDAASGLAFDSAGNLYVSNNGSSGSNSIAVFTTPISNSASYFLDGVSQPGGLIFDSSGNLYVFNAVNSGASLDRFNSNDLSSGATPSISDPAGLSGIPYGAAFAFDSSGNLYMADCGNEPSVKEYQTVSSSFSATEAPSVVFTSSAITNAGCVWGIAVH